MQQGDMRRAFRETWIPELPDLIYRLENPIGGEPQNEPSPCALHARPKSPWCTGAHQRERSVFQHVTCGLAISGCDDLAWFELLRKTLFDAVPRLIGSK